MGGRNSLRTIADCDSSTQGTRRDRSATVSYACSVVENLCLPCRLGGAGRYAG